MCVCVRERVGEGRRLVGTSGHKCLKSTNRVVKRLHGWFCERAELDDYGERRQWD